MRVNLQVLGCRLNEAELQQWAGDFRARGHEITNELDDADLLVVNTCAVTTEAGRKSRQMVRRAQRNNPRAKLVVSGCYATLEQQQAAAIEGVDLVVPNQDKDRLVDRVHRELNVPVMPVLAQNPAENALYQRGRSRAFIKVQDGCRWRCTYCIVTIARGQEKSTPVHMVVDQVNEQAARGVKEIVLTGVHLGGYGSDFDSNLYSLVQTILRETDIPRIRLGSLEPWDLHEDFFALFDDRRLMPHLHLPLQSGADSVLRRMSRRCKTEDFRRLIDSARAHIPHFNVTTDVIVGFPGETDAEWQAGYEYIESIGFGHTHIFSYSPRTGTKAASLAGQVEPGVVRQRSRELHELAQRMKLEFEQQQAGRTFDVLLEEKVEHVDNDQYQYSGYTPNYLRVMVTSKSRSLNNTIVQYQY